MNTYASTQSERYSQVAIALHWIMALAIIGMIALGLFMEDFPAAWRGASYQFHKSLGLTVLFLSFARLAWRLTHRPPALPAATPLREKLLATATHWLFYVLMIAMPLSGWLYISTSSKNYPTSYFGLFTVPKLPVFAGDNRKAAHSFFYESHELLAYGAIALIVLHVSAALFHQYIRKDNMLSRMLPRHTSHKGNAGAL